MPDDDKSNHGEEPAATNDIEDVSFLDEEEPPTVSENSYLISDLKFYAP
jgi:hypothetical protein